MRVTFWSLAVSGAVLGTACGGYRAVQHQVTTPLEWPASQPRIRLETLIDLQAGSSRGAGGKLVRWLGAGQQIRAAGFRRPYAAAWLGDDLLLTDPDAGRVARIRPGGKIDLSRDGLLDHPIGVAACVEGVLVSDAAAGRVGLMDHGLQEVRWLPRSFERPTGVACHGDRLFVVETGRHRLWIRDRDGSGRNLGERGDGPGQFNFPTSVAVSGSDVWVADTLNFRIQRFDIESGRFLGEFGRLGDAPGELARTKGVAVDRTGRLWLSDAHLDRLAFYDRDGAFLMSIGGTGAGPAQFAFPAGIAAHQDGRVAVVDSLNRRVQVFSVIAEEGS